MQWARRLQAQACRWTAHGLDLLYPPRCPFCRRDIPPIDLGTAGEPDTAYRSQAWAATIWAATICAACERELSADSSRCPRCGEAGGTAGGCRFCEQRSPDWRQIVVLSSYGGALRDAVLRAKRPSGDDVTAALASLLIRKHAQTVASWGGSRVVPVPMHWLRRSIRGSSAADELSRRIAGLLGLPYDRALQRHRATRMQNELPIADRPRNVEGAFRARRRLDGERILIVDDVATTGATLSACCRALLAVGALSVDVAVVAKADRSGADG